MIRMDAQWLEYLFSIEVNGIHSNKGPLEK